MSWSEANDLFENLGDLVNVQFQGWYSEQFYRLGRERVLVLAAKARADGKTDKRRYFSVMLKREGLANRV